MVARNCTLAIRLPRQILGREKPAPAEIGALLGGESLARPRRSGPDTPGARRRCSVIDGFRIEMTADELIQHLDTRIQHHRTAASECDAKRIRFEAVGSLPEEEEGEGAFLAVWPGYG